LYFIPATLHQGILKFRPQKLRECQAVIYHIQSEIIKPLTKTDPLVSNHDLDTNIFLAKIPQNAEAADKAKAKLQDKSDGNSIS